MCRRYLVGGRVQGVGYRVSARATAVRLGLQGWVRNCQDGRVEALACGDAAALDEFEAWLRQGPPGARVTAVDVQPHTPELIAGFEVRR